MAIYAEPMGAEPDDIVIRQAIATDHASIGVLRRCWAEEDSGQSGFDPDFERRFEEWLIRVGETRISFVAEKSGQLVGMMHLALFERMPKPGRSPSRWAYLANAFVMDSWRNCGIGAKLLTATTNYARELGCVRVVLSPSELSVPFYERGGFGPATMLMANVLDVRPSGE